MFRKCISLFLIVMFVLANCDLILAVTSKVAEQQKRKLGLMGIMNCCASCLGHDDTACRCDSGKAVPPVFGDGPAYQNCSHAERDFMAAAFTVLFSRQVKSGLSISPVMPQKYSANTATTIFLTSGYIGLVFHPP